MTDPQIPTPKTRDTSGDKSPSFSPGARESASKRCERAAACGGDTLTPGDEFRSQRLANASCAKAVTADVTESPEGGAEPDRPATQQAAPSHPPGNRRANAASTAQVDAMPRWLRRQIEQVAEAYVPLRNAHFVPSILRRPGMVVTPPVTRASGAHLEPLGQHKLDDDAKIPEFLRRQGVTSLATHARPIASDREPSERSQADQPSGSVPSILRRDGLVALPVTPPPPVAGPVTPAVAFCPTCQRRIPARLSAADRQRAYRKRQREKAKPIVP